MANQNNCPEFISLSLTDDFLTAIGHCAAVCDDFINCQFCSFTNYKLINFGGKNDVSDCRN